MTRRLLLLTALALLPIQAAAQSPAEHEKAFAAANTRRQRGETAAAITAYQALYADPACPELLRRKSGYLIGLCHESRFDYPAAIAAYRRLSQDFPESSEAANARAQIHGLSLYQGDNFAALKAQIQAHQLNDQGRHAEAIALLEELGVPTNTRDKSREQLAAWDPDLYSILGDANYELRRYEQAAEAYAAAELLGLPDAGELRLRSLRSITRRRAGHGVRALVAVLALLLLLKKPWRRFTRRRTAILGLTLLSWALASAGLIGLGAYLDVATDHERPISHASIISVSAIMAAPILAAALFASAGKRQPISAALYALAAVAATLFWVLESRDWLMMLGL